MFNFIETLKTVNYSTIKCKIRRKNIICTQQANKQTISRKMELLTALPAIATWVHGNQLH